MSSLIVAAFSTVLKRFCGVPTREGGPAKCCYVAKQADSCNKAKSWLHQEWCIALWTVRMSLKRQGSGMFAMMLTYNVE